MFSKYRAVIYFLFCFFLITSNISALSGIFTGLGLEINGNTREGVAMGGNLTAGLDLNEQFSLGLKAVLSGNFDTIITLEPAAFFRYYIPTLQFSPSFKISGLFAQAELGTAIFFENQKGYPAFLGGAALGWRYNIGEMWYIEPAARFGYPFIWGVSFAGGLRFKL
jgi:hypothetical protein